MKVLMKLMILGSVILSAALSGIDFKNIEKSSKND